MTIHKSKGLEYEVVYFLGLEDSAFWSFNDQPEEDKSAFFVALSRAKSYLIFTCRKCKLVGETWLILKSFPKPFESRRHIMLRRYHLRRQRSRSRCSAHGIGLVE